MSDRLSKQTPKPRWQHDCDECQFIKSFGLENKATVDVWKDHDGEGIILRYSSEPEDYRHFGDIFLRWIGQQPLSTLSESEIEAWHAARDLKFICVQ